MLNEEHAKSLVNKILKLSPARATEILLKYQNIALTRFANNHIIQNVAEDNLNISIRVLHQDKMGRAETNKTDSDALVNCCERALQLAKFSAPDPNTLPLPGRQSYESTNSFYENTYAFNAESRARHVNEMIRLCQDKNANLAGIHKIAASSIAIGNSQGLFAFSKSSHAASSVTAAINGKTGGNIIDEAARHKFSSNNRKQDNR
ncbi:MAG: PmbA/TldA family metallopeptidase, partial [bacterium]